MRDGGSSCLRRSPQRISTTSWDSNGNDQPLVFSRRPGWFEVGLDAKRQGSFRSVKKAWVQDDFRTWRFEPLSPEPAKGIFAAELQTAVLIKDVRRVRGRLWLRVAVYHDTECIRALEDVDEPRELAAEGWMPAHDAAGEPLVWFVTYCD